MSKAKESVKFLVDKLELNPVPLGGKKFYTSKLGKILGGLVMLIVLVYAIGKFSVIQGPENVVSKLISYQNDPYEVDLTDWDLHFSILETTTQTYIKTSNMFSLGLNITALNLEGENLERMNPSALIDYNKDDKPMLGIDMKKTPFVISGSNYVHGSPDIKEYKIEFQECNQTISNKCNLDKTFVYSIVLYMKPKWASLHNPKDEGVLEMNFNEKIKIFKSIPVSVQYTYDISGFNVTSDTSLLPSFIPRDPKCQNGSELAGPSMKIFLPPSSTNLVEFVFRRSAISEEYSRKFNSIDAIFAEILGVVALFSVVLWVLFMHYNMWGSEEYILREVEGSNRSINLLKYFAFYLKCKSRTMKEEKILLDVHQDIIKAFKERNKRKIEIEVLELRIKKLEELSGVSGMEEKCKQEIMERLESEEKEEIENSSLLTEDIRRNLINT